MNTSIFCTINNETVVIRDNSVKTSSISLQNELIKRLISCKMEVTPEESALPLFFNKYLRHYAISNVKFINEKVQNTYAKVENWGEETGLAA